MCTSRLAYSEDAVDGWVHFWAYLTPLYPTWDSFWVRTVCMNMHRVSDDKHIDKTYHPLPLRVDLRLAVLFLTISAWSVSRLVCTANSNWAIAKSHVLTDERNGNPRDSITTVLLSINLNDYHECSGHGQANKFSEWITWLDSMLWLDDIEQINAYLNLLAMQQT